MGSNVLSLLHSSRHLSEERWNFGIPGTRRFIRLKNTTIHGINKNFETCIYDPIGFKRMKAFCQDEISQKTHIASKETI